MPRDPQSWSKEHVGHWLSWAIREFNLTGLTGQFEQFRVSNTLLNSPMRSTFTLLDCSSAGYMSQFFSRLSVIDSEITETWPLRILTHIFKFNQR